jgi:hypothetical protein
VLVIGGLMMTRTTWTLAFFFVSLFTVHVRAAKADVRDPHIRSLDREMLDELENGARLSPTLQRLVDRLEASDVVVYLMFDRAARPGTAGHISLITTVPGRRYLRISIDRRHFGCRRLAVLGHELQHAVEIAEAPGATDQDSVASLYRTIGFKSDTGRSDCFDSQLAIDTGLQVQREILAAARTMERR